MVPNQTLKLKLAWLQVTLLSFIHRHAKHYRVGRSYARWQVPLAPGPAVILRQSERWWGWSRWGSRLPSCPVQLLAGPEVGGSSRDAITTQLPAWRISVQPTLFSLLGFPRCQEDESMLLLAYSLHIFEEWRSLFKQECFRGRASTAPLRAEHQQSMAASPHWYRYSY